MPKYQNIILASLSKSEIASLRPNLEPVDLPLRTVLIEPGIEIEHVVFLESGLGSQVIVENDEARIEVGIIGVDGIIGLPVVLGRKTSPHRTFMQVGGAGYRVRASVLIETMEGTPALHRSLLHYANAFMLQLAQTAFANGRYKIQPRLARWLLMSADRLKSEDVPLTHEFLGLMLGIRRAGVTEALAELENGALIRSIKGNITLLNRDTLIQMAGAAYP